VHFPFYCFALQVEDRGSVREVWAGADGVLGTLVLLEKSRLQLSERDQTPEFPFLLSRSEARAKVEADYRWILYRAKLKRYPCRLLSLDEGDELWYPYWVGYFRVRGRWDFEVLDAVTGLPVGGPLRLAFLRGLVAGAQGSKPPGGRGEGK